MIQKSIREILGDNRKLLLFMFLAGFSLRFVFALLFKDGFYFSDSLHYEDGAIGILEGNALAITPERLG